MKKFYCLAVVAGMALALSLLAPNTLAQGAPGGGAPGGGGPGFGGAGPGGGGFNMTTMMQGRADAMRPELGVTNDDEWNVISPRLVKVMQLQLEVRTAGMANMFRGAGGQGGGGGGRRGGFAAMLGGTPDPASDALDAAVTGNAPIPELKAAMAGVRDARKRKLAEMTKAQSDLKDVISVRQEAYLLNSGLLD